MKKLMLVCLALLCLFAGCRKDSKKPSGRSDWKPPETEAEEEWTGPTVTVAFSTKLSGSIPTKIKNFEKNEAVKVIQLDYSQYNTSLEPRGGEDKLALDLTTGLIKPDIIISPGPSSKEAIVIEETHLYRDLTSYLEVDDLLNPGNIFGSVLELYTADDGTIWGLPDEIGAEMLIGNDAVLGEYAGRDGWTLDEMLDFAESLPADVTLVPVLFQQTAPSILLGPVGYSIFVDRKAGTCSFDSPSFLRWLKFLKALPATYDELKAKSPYDATPPTTTSSRWKKEHIRFSISLWKARPSSARMPILPSDSPTTATSPSVRWFTGHTCSARAAKTRTSRGACTAHSSSRNGRVTVTSSAPTRFPS